MILLLRKMIHVLNFSTTNIKMLIFSKFNFYFQSLPQIYHNISYKAYWKPRRTFWRCFVWTEWFFLYSDKDDNLPVSANPTREVCSRASWTWPPNIGIFKEQVELKIIQNFKSTFQPYYIIFGDIGKILIHGNFFCSISELKLLL